MAKYDGEIRAVADVSGELEDLLAERGEQVFKLPGNIRYRPDLAVILCHAWPPVTP